MKCQKHELRPINNKPAVQCTENQFFTTWLGLASGKISAATATLAIKTKTPKTML